MKEAKTYYDNKRGIKVSTGTLSTRYKDEALAHDQSVLVGRDPLWFGCISGIGLILFCYQFGDLLFLHEKITIAVIGVVILILGYSIAALRIGQFMRERTVFWGSVWTVNAVRHAIFQARTDMKGQSRSRYTNVADEL